jgi:hypothetical protein
MKKNILLSAMLIAVCGMFAGCSGDTDSQVKTDLTPKTLELTIAGSNAGKTRTSGTAGDEAAVNNLVIGIFDATSGNVDNIKSVDVSPISNGTGTVKVTYTTSSPKIVVIANAPKADFTSATTYAGFKGVAANLDHTTATAYADGAFTDAVGNNTTVGTQKSTMLPMIGEISSSDISNGAATVSISRIVSRISISSITTDFSDNVTYKGYTLDINEIFIANAHNSIHFDMTNAAGTMQGLTTNETSYLSYLGSGVLSDATAPYTTNHYFYTFPSAAEVKLKLIIKATLKKNAEDQGTVVYYPIVINKAQTGTEISDGDKDGKVDANKTYALTAVIKNTGVDDPSKEITPADVTLTVSVSAWAANLTQAVTF